MNKSAIKEFRSQKGMTLEEFGQLISPVINKSTVLRWERKVPAERIVEIERATGIPRSDLRPDLFIEQKMTA